MRRRKEGTPSPAEQSSSAWDTPATHSAERKEPSGWSLTTVSAEIAGYHLPGWAEVRFPRAEMKSTSCGLGHRGRAETESTQIWAGSWLSCLLAVQIEQVVTSLGQSFHSSEIKVLPIPARHMTGEGKVTYASYGRRGRAEQWKDSSAVLWAGVIPQLPPLRDQRGRTHLLERHLPPRGAVTT